MADRKTMYSQAVLEEGPKIFKLSTRDVQNYIQDRLNMVVSLLKKNDEKYANLRDLQVRICGSALSKQFITLIVILPEDALESNATNSRGDIPEIWFRSHDEEAQLTLIPAVQQMFKLFAYSKEDMKVYRSHALMNQLHITRRQADNFVQTMVPRYRTFQNNASDGTPLVVFSIDPIRVFHDMIRYENEASDQFTLQILDFNKIRNAEYVFRVKKNYRGKKNNKNEANIMKEVDSLLRRM